jgi:diguanylate cyclase (GGDEF)-like protein
MKTVAEQLLACAELGKAVTQTLDRERILEVILNRLSELVAAHNWTLYLLDEKKQELRFELVAGLDRVALVGATIKVGQGIAGSVAQTGEPCLVPDAEKDPRIDRTFDRSTGFVTRSLITLPLKRCEQVIGVLQVVNPEDESLFEKNRLPVLGLIADFVAIALNNALNHERVRALTVTDDVTGYFNARFLHQTLGELIEASTETSLVFLDMDHFKRIVDAYGHPLGGKVLQEVAGVIGSQLDPGDSLVRYGGDEYVILLPGQEKEAALEKVERIRSALISNRFLVEEGHDVAVTASFGIAHYPRDATDVKELLRNADLSLYRSKDRGKNTITVF